MAQIKKLGRPTDERMAVLRNQATDFLWNGKLETTLQKAKSTQSFSEKIITLAINSYEDTIKVEKEIKDAKGNKIKKETINDGIKKLNARRKMLTMLYDVKVKRLPKESKSAFDARTSDIKYPLIEKIFNEYAPKFATRKAELGQGGGYSKVVKLGTRRGDNAQIALLQLI